MKIETGTTPVCPNCYAYVQEHHTNCSRCNAKITVQRVTQYVVMSADEGDEPDTDHDSWYHLHDFFWEDGFRFGNVNPEDVEEVRNAYADHLDVFLKPMGYETIKMDDKTANNSYQIWFRQDKYECRWDDLDFDVQDAIDIHRQEFKRDGWI